MPTASTTAPETLRFSTNLARKHPRLPVYVVLPHAVVAPWGLQATTLVEGTANGHTLGRRTLKRWDASPKSPWFLEFTAPWCKAAGVVVGDALQVELTRASTGVPAELQAVLMQSPERAAAWQELSDAVQRVAMEHVRAGKGASTRERRAALLAQRLHRGD
ncbi:MAG: YdeI/OmpD-associated family protein [Pseudomonadota bacterium]